MPKITMETLSEQMYYVLLALQEKRCGREICDYVAKVTSSRIQLGPGTLYSILSKFIQFGYIVEHSTNGRMKYYIISLDGKEVLCKEQERLQQILLDTQMIMNGSI